MSSAPWFDGDQASVGDARQQGRPLAGRFGIVRAVLAPSPGLWVAAAALALVDALWLWRAGIRLEPAGFLGAAALVAILVAAGAFWRLQKPEPVLAGMALASAALAAFTIAVALLHYLAATLAPPLVDAELASLEAALGFDWRSHRAFLEAHPRLATALALAYHSSGPQVALVVIALSAARRFDRLWAFVRLFAATLFVVIAIAAVFPAEGAYALYAPNAIAGQRLETIGGTWHLAPLAELRSGSVATIALGDIRGLATFPSFHVCLALITAWALAPIPWLGLAAILLNAAVIVATLGAGGHYLPDLLAGALLAALALVHQHRARAQARTGTRAPSPKSWRTRSAVMRAPS